MKNKNILFIIGAILIFIFIVSTLVFLINTFGFNRGTERYGDSSLSPFVEPSSDFYMYWPMGPEFESLANFGERGVMSIILPPGAPIVSALAGEVSSLLFGPNIFPGMSPQAWANNPPIWLVSVISHDEYEIRYVLTGDVMVQVGQKLEVGQLIARSGGGSMRYLFQTDPTLAVSAIKNNQLIILNQGVMKRR